VEIKASGQYNFASEAVDRASNEPTRELDEGSLSWRAAMGRSGGEKVLDQIEFRNCAPGVRGIVETVVQYSLETMDEQDLG
jgi:hypothetical protein